MEIPIKCKDPDSRVDFQFDWSSHFTDGDTIESVEVIGFEGLTVEEPTHVGNVVTVWVSGGVVGSLKLLTCRVTTQMGRVEDASCRLKIVEL